ncbi:hypothetical protein K523DRAFT_421908, partial [Schizophyllum commune Tattone D]
VLRGRGYVGSVSSAQSPLRPPYSLGGSSGFLRWHELRLRSASGGAQKEAERER